MFNSLLKIDGYFYYIGGKTGGNYYLYNAVPLKLDISDLMYVKKIDKAIQLNDYQEKDDRNRCIISKERNEELFTTIISKIEHGIYKNRKGSLGTSVLNGRDVFFTLSVEEQCKVITNIISAFASNTQNIDLSLLNESAHAGTMLLSKNIDKLKECFLINQSVTGLYKSKVDLLHL